MNETPAIGHNQTPFQITTNRIQEIYDEIKNWADGDPLTTKEQHDTLVELVREIRTAKTKADVARKDEAKQFDDGKKEVQDRYNPFIQPKKGKVDLAIEVAQQVLAPFLQEQERLKRIAEKKAAEEANKLEAEAIAAMEASKGNLEKRQEAEALVKDAKDAGKAHKKIADTNIAKGGKSVWDTEIVNTTEAMRHYWPTHKAHFEEAMTLWAKEQVRQGKRDIPGFKITERKVI